MNGPSWPGGRQRPNLNCYGFFFKANWVSVMLELRRPTRRRNRPLRPMLQESNIFIIIIIFYINGYCIKHDVNIAVRIFYTRIGYQNYLYTYYF